MNGGQITQSGSYEELLTDGKEQLVNAHRDSITGLGPSNNETKENLRSYIRFSQRCLKGLTSVWKTIRVRLL